MSVRPLLSMSAFFSLGSDTVSYAATESATEQSIPEIGCRSSKSQLLQHVLLAKPPPEQEHVRAEADDRALIIFPLHSPAQQVREGELVEKRRD